MEYQASSPTLSKKLPTGRSFSSKSVYDGVFSARSSKFGTPSFSSRVLDYREIFGGSEASRGSSIPFLEVPALNERDVEVDARGTKLDYSKVFGGFGELDCAVSYEELVSEPKKRTGFSQKTRSSAQRGSFSQGADLSDCQEKNQMNSHEASHQSFDGVKKFSTSYNKVNQGGKNGTNGETHIAQLHAVPAYTCLIDEMTTLQMNDGKNPVSSAVNGTYIEKAFSDGLTETVHSTKVVTDLPAGGATIQKCEGGVALENKSNEYRSNSIDMLFGANECGHGHSSKVSPSSIPLPDFGGSKCDSERSMAEKFWDSEIHLDGAEHVSSLPDFDEEVDANSFAAASVAALKKAIEEAQAKMNIVKESMARKKAGLQNHANLSRNYGLKADLRREGKATKKANKYKEKDSNIYEKEDTPVQVSAGMRKQNMMRAGHNSDIGNRESLIGTNAAFGETYGRESRSTQAYHRQATAKLSDETEQFYELVSTGEHKETILEFEQADNTKKEGFEKPEECSERLNEVVEAHKEVIDRKINVVEVAVKIEEHGGELKSVQQVHDHEDYVNLRVIKEREGSVKKVKASREHEKCEEKLGDLKEAICYEENIETQEFEENESIKGRLEPHERAGNEKKGKGLVKRKTFREEEDAYTREDTEKRLNKVHLQAVTETRFNDFQDEEENRKSHEANSDLEENEKLQEGGENERLLKGDAYQIEEKENRKKETFEWIEAEKIQTDIDQSAEDQERLEVAQEALNYEENLLEVADDPCKTDESENLSKNQKVDRHVENDKDAELTLEVTAQEENGSGIAVNKASIKQKESVKESEFVKDKNEVKATKEAFCYEDCLETADDGCKQDGSEKANQNHKAITEEKDDKHVDVTLEVPNGSTIEVNVPSVEQEQNVKELECVKDENEVKVTEEALPDEYSHETADDECKQDGSEKLRKNHVASRQEENDTDVEILAQENASRFEVDLASVKQKEDVKESKCVKDEIEVKTTKEALCDKDNLETADDGCKQDGFEKLSKTHEASRKEENDKVVEVTLEVPAHEENTIIMEINTAFFEYKEYGKKVESVNEANDMEDKEILEETVGLPQNTFRLAETKQKMEDMIETVVFESEGMDFVKTDMSFGQKQNYLLVEEHKTVFNLGRNIEELAPELGEIYMNVKEGEVTADQEEDRKDSTSSHEEKWVDGNKVKADQEEDGNDSTSACEERCDDDGNKVKAVQIPNIFEGEGKSVETSLEIKITPIIEKIETHQSNVTMEEKESNGAEQKYVELEKEQFNVDDTKEQEREREREKMAVERAIREARERAFADAKERAIAERAAAEARRRVMMEGREKLGKTSVANEKSSAEKAAMEAKLKTERAAVERATAEARERALERAMSEKAASETRNRAEKSVGERFSGASGDNGRRQSFSHNEPQNKGSSSTSNSRYPHSSSQFPHSTERFDGANEESVQRCKATSERHQIVAERTAKALAEKNTRDLLAQKEQAERNRLAESLDADVKRWSSGKEGNLRALLSTLQYILGSDSGWQPIPLTEIIATSAVKKAYRKATLFVHPDKLQQRGASIQQKYTCEKVFDLLKEAWNRFNVEER
ncbi:LOW QUALITY PROTEIN: auxilin-like protein 1 [Juglans microcarpa x Juglans regia]|uniref:LOW QUALITY PROTEIN: auxilin-like protein 1 n=1 Tax=Juglans microcarpa x Juglans regia TaxID=2249226 RepID=UPI001B7DD054|nr:LOW QUALITY PROTEIN: auxilin-like protein 1 [Juglans microcarpa x Juglans regia]